MAISKRIFSVVLAIAMVLSFVQIGASAIDISAGETITANQASMVDDGSGREVIPQATVTATEVIRVAASVGSMAKGSTIVPATPSGVPQITSTYAAEAYSGETPSYPTVIFKTDLSLAKNKNVTIKFSNSSVTYTVTNPDSKTWIWTITGGTATAGSYLDYEIGYAYTYTDRLTGKSVTNTYVAYGSSYVEGIIQPAGMYIDSYRTKPWNHSGTDADFVYRILGLNTYGSYYDPGDGSAGSGDNFKKNSSVWAHGYFDFVSMAPVQWGWDANEAAGYGSVLWGVDNDNGNRYGNTSVDRQRAVSTTYIDSSRGTALNGANINLRYAVMDLRYGSKDDEYTRSISSFSVLPGESGFDSNYEDNATASTQLAPASMGSEVVFRDGNTIPSTPYRISNYALSVPFNGTTYKDAMATLADGTKEIKYTFISSLYGRYHASDRMIANHTAVHLHFIMYNNCLLVFYTG